MMLLIGYIPTPEGWAALDLGIQEAVWRNAAVTVVNVAIDNDFADITFADEKDLDPVRARLTDAHLAHTVKQVLNANDVADTILDLAHDIHADLIVIGLKHRLPLAIAVLGSTAARIIQSAPCPVLSVRLTTTEA